MIAALFVPLSECCARGKDGGHSVAAKDTCPKIFPRSDEQTDYDYGATRLGPSKTAC